MRNAGLVALLGLAMSAVGQAPSRAAYRDAYRAWRQTEPSLESSTKEQAALAPRTERAAGAAATFIASRAAFLSVKAEQTRQQQLWLELAIPRPVDQIGGETVRNVTAASVETLEGMITRVAGERDAAIVQFRQGLERERAALMALGESQQLREQAAASVARITGDLEQARQAAVTAHRVTAERRAANVDQLRQEGVEWAAYYRLLAEGARGVVEVTSAAGPDVAEAAPITPPGEVTTPPAEPAPQAPAPPPAPAAIVPPLPLLRYTGEWMFPANGVYKGAQPESVELRAAEEGGRMSGSLSAVFALPAGAAGDRSVRFDFEGELQASRNQVFALRTADGGQGTIQIIPGPAFNLLEVNFEIDSGGAGVRAANFLLLKK